MFYYSFTLILFLTITVLYGLKAIRHFEDVKPILNTVSRINFFSAISISLILQSIAFMTYWPLVSMTFGGQV
jgi:tellurite resistance protein